MIRTFRYVLRKFYFASALLLITLAAVVQSGRMLAPLVSDYRDQVADYIGQRLNARVVLQDLQLQWDGMKPVVSLAGLSVTSFTDEPIVAVDEAYFRLDLLRSLSRWQLAWGNVDLNGTRLVFQQTREGFWHIPGLDSGNTSAQPEKARSGFLLDMLLLVDRMEFRHTHLAFHFYNGQQVALDSPSLLLENEQQFHRIELKVDVEGRGEAVHLVLESEGDPRDQPRFALKGYLALHDFPTSEPFIAAGGLLLGDVTLGRVTSEGGLNAKLWFNSRAGNEGYDVHGQLDLQTLSVPFFDKHYRLDHFSTGINGYWLRSGAWQMMLPNLNARLQDTRIEGVNLAMSAAGQQAPMVVQLDQFPLQDALAGVNESGLLKDSGVLQVLNTLNPQGYLDRIRFELPLRDPAAWRVEAMANNVSVSAWNGVPALTGVNGYVQAHQRGGFINLISRDDFSMHYVPTYSEAMHYQQAQGQIAWWLQPENKQIYVNSGAIHLRSEHEEATGYLWLAIPWHNPGADLDLYLHIGAKHLAAAEYKKYVPATVPPNLSEWLQASIGGDNPGVANEAGFVFRGTLNTPENNARSYQLYLDLENASLDYHADWPALTALKGRLLVDDEMIDASVFSGKLYESDLSGVHIATRPNPYDEGALLTITGDVAGIASDGLRVLREGYMRELIGSNMDSWYFQGTHRTRVDIAVPLLAEAKGSSQQVDVSFDMPLVGMENLSLYLRDVDGQIRYSSEEGLRSDRLTALLFDQPVTATLETRKEDNAQSTLIHLDGRVDADDLAGWASRPEILFFKGLVPYQATVAIAHQGDAADSESDNRTLVSVIAKSNLAGALVDLPEPFAKPIEAERDFSVQLDIGSQQTEAFIDYRLDEVTPLVQARFMTSSGEDTQLLNADVTIAGEAVLQAEPQFRVSGYVESVDINAWLQVRDRYEVYQRQIQEQPGSVTEEFTALSDAPGMVVGLPLHIDVLLGQQALGPLALENIALNAWRQSDAWQLTFNNPVLKGSVRLPDARSIPMAIAIDELHLTRELLGDSNPASEDEQARTLAASLTDTASQFDPRSLPRADVAVQALYLEGHNYGDWSLQVRPDNSGVMFNRIRGNLRGIAVSGVPATETANIADSSPLSGAQIYWSTGDEGHRTRFVGVLTATDMAEVMREWEKPDILESSNAVYQVDLEWPGAPGQFSLKTLRGDIDLALEEGRFNRSTGAGEGVLRLLSLVNFDTLARRLRLDFSDLYKTGLAFDSIQGRIHFDNGQLQLTEPLLVEGPSSRLQLAGTIDLQQETIDARLVAALPVAGNLTFLAALATGLPAAAGIYLVSKIFRKQVNQATSVSYTIRGNWDDPVMKFDRLFESEESLRQNVSNRREEAEESNND